VLRCERDTTMMRWTIGLVLGGALLLSSLTLSRTALASRAEEPVSTPSTCDHETLSHLEKAQLRIKRNTVFARYGRSFRSADLKAYFGAQPWYKPNPAYSDSLVKPSEKSCVDRILLWEKGARPTWSVAIDFNGDSRKERAFLFDRRPKAAEDHDEESCSKQFIVAVGNETYQPCVHPNRFEDFYEAEIAAIDIDSKDNRQELLVTTRLFYNIDPPIYNWILAHSGTHYTASTLVGEGDSGGALTIKGDGIVRMEDFEIHGGGRHCRYVTNEKSYPLKNGTFPKPTVKVVQTHSAGCAACPFVEVWTQQGWVRIGEILRHIDAPEKKSWDKLSLVHTGGRLTIRLLEEKAEITKLDAIGIRTDDGFILPTTCGSALAKWCKLDGGVFEMVEGDIQVFHFDLPLQALGKVSLEAFGHYEPL
jgi:hypothetical protein